MLEVRFKGAIENGLERFIKWTRTSNINNLWKPKINLNTYVTSDIIEMTENKPLLELGSIIIQPIFLDEDGTECLSGEINSDPEYYLTTGIVGLNVSSHLLIEEGHVSSIEEAERLKETGVFMRFIFKYNLSGFTDSLDLRLMNDEEVCELKTRNVVLTTVKGDSN